MSQEVVVFSRLLALIVLGLVATSCSVTAPDRPSPSQWREQAAQTLEDVASEVAVTQLALEAQQEDKLLGKAGVVLLVEAEEQTGTTVDKFTALQPPTALEGKHAAVVEALEQASSQITDARTARVRELEADYPALVRRLKHEHAALMKLRDRVT